MQLPVNIPFSQMLTRWSSILNPFVANPSNNSSVLSNISLTVGINSINHLLGRTMQGWFLVDQNSVGTVYRSAPLNDKTLTLTSSAAMTVSIGVF
jgi:hypothetical protein